MNREQTNYNMVIGYNKDSLEIFVCNYIFDDNKGFKGATGSILSPISPEQVEEYNDIEYVLERLDGCGILKDEYDEDIRAELEEDFKSEYDAVDFETTEQWEEALEDYISENAYDLVEKYNREIAENELRYCYGSFPFHDDSDIGCITSEDEETLAEAFDMEIETFECIGAGRIFGKHVFTDGFVSMDDELVASIKLIEGIA